MSDLTNFPLGQAIHCDCYIFKYRRYKVLGSITSEGLLEIVRPHENKTTIQSHEFTLICHTCGYKQDFKINNINNA